MRKKNKTKFKKILSSLLTSQNENKTKPSKLINKRNMFLARWEIKPFVHIYSWIYIPVSFSSYTMYHTLFASVEREQKCNESWEKQKINKNSENI